MNKSLTTTLSGLEATNTNPIIPGYYADPSVVQYDGKIYVYATIDPWGGESLACWESEDGREWTYRFLNWPTKVACTTPESGPARVWAPSVVQGSDSQFYMYVSVGSEVWCGTASHPLGPWRNMLGDSPLIGRNYYPGYHMIDAEAFIDDDGSAWLYWGSGLEWVNGRCWAVRLGADMASFDGEPCDVTPDNYFEAPFMVKNQGRYYLMYSNGRTDQDTYQVHYAIGASPSGPFVEAPNSPILVTDADRNVLSPGHHTVFRIGDEWFIMYHRHCIPFDPAVMRRQLCVDKLVFNSDGLIEGINPTHSAPDCFHRRPRNVVDGVSVHASSWPSLTYGPERVLEDCYASRWQAKAEDPAPWIVMDMGREVCPHRQAIHFEYAWKPHWFGVETSLDGRSWVAARSINDPPMLGSPVDLDIPTPTRYVRLSFDRAAAGESISIISWRP